MAEKIKYQLEFSVNASPQMLYQYISVPSGLAMWYADDVRSSDEDVYTFVWDNSEESALLLRKKLDDYVRFRWQEEEDESIYFEIKIRVQELTKEVTLVITDFAPEDEVEEAKRLWETQIAELKALIGA